MKPEPYKSTPIFDENTLPAALQNAHNTKAGTWGLLDLISGTLDYVIEDSGETRRMTAGDQQIIIPEQRHHVELTGPMEMQVHFLTSKPEDCFTQ